MNRRVCHLLQDQLIQEAQVMKGFRHPNLLMLHCSFIHGSDLWLVMPFVAGGSLANVIGSKCASPLLRPDYLFLLCVSRVQHVSCEHLTLLCSACLHNKCASLCEPFPAGMGSPCMHANLGVVLWLGCEKS